MDKDSTPKYFRFTQLGLDKYVYLSSEIYKDTVCYISSIDLQTPSFTTTTRDFMGKEFITTGHYKIIFRPINDTTPNNKYFRAVNIEDNDLDSCIEFLPASELLEILYG
jgi:hypothetical protein